MPSLPGRLRSLREARISPRAYRTVTVVALVLLGTIVVSGAAVRLTGSGMGCPTWPTCEHGSLVPKGETGDHGWIEFLNRTFTGAVSIAVALAVLGARRLRPPRPDLTLLAWGLVAGVFAQALLGGLVVLLDVAPVAVAAHYLLSAVLVATAVLLHHRAGQPPGPRRPAATPELQRWSRALVAITAAALVLGTVVTGAGPHGGDTDARRLPFHVRTVVPLHSGMVWILLFVTLAVLQRVERGDTTPEAAGRGRLLVIAILAQGGLGYLQYFTGVPEGLVGLHVLGSVLVWIAVLRFHLGLTEPLPTEGEPAGTDPLAAAT